MRLRSPCAERVLAVVLVIQRSAIRCLSFQTRFHACNVYACIMSSWWRHCLQVTGRCITVKGEGKSAGFIVWYLARSAIRPTSHNYTLWSLDLFVHEPSQLPGKHTVWLPLSAHGTIQTHKLSLSYQVPTYSWVERVHVRARVRRYDFPKFCPISFDL